jgi:hypothetical protein
MLFVAGFREHQDGLTPHPEQENNRIEAYGDLFYQTRRDVFDFSVNLAAFIETAADFDAVDPVFAPHFLGEDDPVAFNHFFLRFCIQRESGGSEKTRGPHDVTLVLTDASRTPPSLQTHGILRLLKKRRNKYCIVFKNLVFS